MSLDRRIQVACAQLELKSLFGSITAYNSSGSGGKAEGGECPPGEAHPPHDQYRSEYRAAVDDVGRERVCRRAEAALRALAVVRAVVVVPETRDERERRILSKPGWPAADVARWIGDGCLPREVHRVRIEDGLDPERGLEPPTMPDRTERVLALAARNCSVRQIEAQTDIPRSTVQRILRRAA